jgi:hypothetical protein
LGKHIPKGRKITQEEWRNLAAEIFFKFFFGCKDFRLTDGEALRMGISEHPAEKKLHDNRALAKIIFEKPLTTFGFVIWSLPRWHHCQAETISSESSKTSVTRLNQAE